MPRRWLVLSAFASLVICTQLLWLSFAAVTDRTAHALHVGSGAVGDLAVVNPAVFVLLAIPAGRWMDRHYGRALAAGALATALGAIIRAVDPHSFGWVLAGQVVMSVGQPLTLNGTTKIAARYFGRDQRTTAIAIGSAAQFVGILLAVATSAALLDAGGLRLLLAVQAAVTVLAAAAVLVSLRVPAFEDATAAGVGSLGWLRRDPVTWWMAGLLFVGVGIYNALATWLDQVMVDFGHHGVAGTQLALMTVAGIAGAAVLPGLAAQRNRRRDLCIACTLVLAAVLTLVAVVPGVRGAVVVGVLLLPVGALLLGALPVLLDWSELHVGAARAATATGVLLLAGNLGGVIVVLTVQGIVHHGTAALLVMAAWGVPGLIAATKLPRRVALV